MRLQDIFVGIGRSKQTGLPDNNTFERDSHATPTRDIDTYDDSDTHPFTAVSVGNSLVLRASRWRSHADWLTRDRIERARVDRAHGEEHSELVRAFAEYHGRFHEGALAACQSDFCRSISELILFKNAQPGNG